MSHNTVRIRLEFSFKAETLKLDTVIDLDQCLAESAETPNFHHLLAKAHDIDPYSYLYEALESYDLEFSDPTGIAVSCCHESHLDWPQFVQRRHEEQEMQVIRVIAAQTMKVTDLDERSDLRAALLAAYRQGKADR